MPKPDNFERHAIAFKNKLDNITIATISPEIYCKKYLSHLLQHKKYYLAVYVDVLYKLTIHSGHTAKDITLIDYGAGNGLLGIFAKFCGFKKVWIIDNNEKFVWASKKLAGQLDIFMDDHITGDIETLKTYFINETPGAIVGTDVIEHIYNLESFFSGIQLINPAMVSVFTTGSNPANYFKVRELKKIQLKDELKGGSPADHFLFGEAPLKPFLKIREQMITQLQPQLQKTEILQLAKATRGLNAGDIQKAVEQYQDSQKMPVAPTGFNTCNPENGSWTERLLSFKTYISLYEAADFTCEFYTGFYNDQGAGIKNSVKKLLNAGITIFGKKISPYIVIAGFKK